MRSLCLEELTGYGADGGADGGPVQMVRQEVTPAREEVVTTDQGPFTQALYSLSSSSRQFHQAAIVTLAPRQRNGFKEPGLVP